MAVRECVRSAPREIWIHLIGDSSMRFWYASFLTILNGSTRRPGFPLHELPVSDECAFVRGSALSQCVLRWRGPCDEDEFGCTLDAQGPGWRLTFEWWHSPRPVAGLVL